MKILGFETSCDDTAVAIVEDGTNVLANIRQSQVEHNDWGGVVPEIAARLHAERWRPVLEKCLTEAKCSMDDIDALAVTAGPGLQTSLLTGTTAASFLSLALEKPLIPVNHIHGHLCSTVLDRDASEINFPALVLTVSGGHTSLYVCESLTEVGEVGRTLDDAAGEAYDKVAKVLNLGYPGGPIVSQYAEKGNPEAFAFPRTWMGKDSLDFSFSGLKAAVKREVVGAENIQSRPRQNRHSHVGVENFQPLRDKFVADICASFQMAVRDVFIQKLKRALAQFPQTKSIHFVGGVSANTFLRSEIEQFCKQNDCQFFTTQKFVYSTDNAAMIAGAAYWLVQQNPDLMQIQFVDANPRLALRV